MDFTDNNTSYLLKLDYIDANYIANLGLKYADDSCPLWSITGAKTRRYDDNFVEFRVLAGRRNDSTAEPVSSEDGDFGYPVYKCAVCDVHVPTAYLKEHNNSTKHKTCRKIGKIALPRMYDYLMRANKIGVVKGTPNTYFSKSCVVIVKNLDKLEYEESRAPQKGVLHDLYLNDLLKYVNNDFDTAVVQNLKATPNHVINDGIPHNSCSSYECNIIDLNETVKNLSGYMENHATIDKALLDADYEDAARDSIVEQTNFNSKQTKVDIKSIADGLNNSPDPVDEQHDINTNSVIKTLYQSVDDQNHSDAKQERIGDNNSTNEQRVQNDTTDQINENNSNKPLADKNIGTTNDPDYLVEYIMLIESKEYYVDLKSESENCCVLNESDLQAYLYFISKLNQDLPRSKLTLINKDYVEIQTQDNWRIAVGANNFIGFYMSDEILQCRLCMRVVSEHATDHIYDIDHIANILLLLPDQHCFRKINFTTAQCVICNVNFTDMNLHKSLESHLSALKEAASRFLEFESINRNCRSYCQPCHMNIDSQFLNSHIDKCQHKKELNNIIKTQALGTVETLRIENIDTVQRNEKQSNTDDKEIHCEPCNLRISSDNFANHVNSKSHTASLKLCNGCEVKKDNSCVTCNLYTDKSDHVTGKYHEFHLGKVAKDSNEEAPVPVTSTSDSKYHVKIEDVTKVHCKICSKHLDIQSIANHTNGKVHQKNYKLLLELNLIKKNINKCYFCDACKTIIHPTKELSHIESKTHVSALSKLIAAKTFCDVCKIYVITQNRSSHLSGEFHKSQVNKLRTDKNIASVIPTPTTSIANLDYQVQITRLTLAKCRICKRGGSSKKLANSEREIVQHTHGRNHIQNFNALLNKNKIKKVNFNFYCEPCKIDIHRSEELYHVETKAHKRALAQYFDQQLRPPSVKEHESAFYRLAKTLIDNNTRKHLDQDLENDARTVAVRCLICDTNVPVEEFSKHLKFSSHSSNYALGVLSENSMERLDNSYFCHICTVDVENGQVMKHIRSLTHLFERQLCNSNRSGDSCAVCQMPPNGLTG